MKLLSWLANQVSKRGFDVHMHILSVSPPHELSPLNLAPNHIEAVENLIPIIGSDQSLEGEKTRSTEESKNEAKAKLNEYLMSKHRGVGAASDNVVAVESFIEGD